MRRIALDYGSSGYSYIRLVGLGILIASLGVSGYLGYTYIELNQKLSALESQQQRLDQQKASSLERREVGPVPDNLRSEIEHANDVIRQLTLPWNQLFESIEAIPHEYIAVLAIQPDAINNKVTIIAEAESAEDIATYIDAINESDTFEDAHIVNHQIKMQDPQKPVGFTMVAKWNLAN